MPGSATPAAPVSAKRARLATSGAAGLSLPTSTPTVGASDAACTIRTRGPAASAAKPVLERQHAEAIGGVGGREPPRGDDGVRAARGEGDHRGREGRSARRARGADVEGDRPRRIRGSRWRCRTRRCWRRRSSRRRRRCRRCARGGVDHPQSARALPRRRGRCRSRRGRRSRRGCRWQCPRRCRCRRSCRGRSPPRRRSGSAGSSEQPSHTPAQREHHRAHTRQGTMKSKSHDQSLQEEWIGCPRAPPANRPLRELGSAESHLRCREAPVGCTKLVQTYVFSPRTSWSGPAHHPRSLRQGICGRSKAERAAPVASACGRGTPSARPATKPPMWAQ